jgi:two-component system, NarL family, response regulator
MFYISGEIHFTPKRVLRGALLTPTFLFAMRTQSNSNSAAHGNRGRAVRGGLIRIVVADDHPIVREGIVANLEQQRDMKVVAEGSNGDEAMALVKRHLPDIALLDLRMPHMDGAEVATQINESNLPTRVIVMTTFENQEEIMRVIKAGARAYLLKDCSRRVMLETIHRVFNGEVYLLPQIAQKLVDRMQKPQLSPRELEVLGSIATGKSNKEIGVQFFISEGTVKTHVASLLEKLGVEGRISAVKEAVRLGLVNVA